MPSSREIGVRGGRPADLERAAARLVQLRGDPLAFCGVLGVEPDAWQARVLGALGRGENVSIRSAHGVGKSALLSWCVLWALCCFPHSKVPCTAPTEHQLWDVLWAEIGRWLKRSEFARFLQWTQTRVCVRGYEESWYAVARTARAPENLAGFHAPKLLYVVDEASGIKDELMEVVEGALTTGGAQAILAGNPTRPDGYFHDTHTRWRDMWATFKVSSLESPRVDARYARQMARRWGEDSNVYRVRVLGEFPTENDDSFMKLSDVEAAVARHGELAAGEPVELGVDVARFGDDETVFALRGGDKVLAIERKKGWDTMRTAGRALQIAKERSVSLVRVDDTGVGGGVSDRLREMGLNVVRVNFGASGDADYLNQAGVLWGGLREKMGVIGLPDDDELVAQLTCRKWSVTSSGKILLEKKGDLKKRGLPSPDIADAVALAFGGLAMPAFGALVRPKWYDA